jgi:hypothetical protein
VYDELKSIVEVVEFHTLTGTIICECVGKCRYDGTPGANIGAIYLNLSNLTLTGGAINHSGNAVIHSCVPVEFI